MERAKLALTILSIDLKNARARNRKRQKQTPIPAHTLGIDTQLKLLGRSLTDVKDCIRRIDRLERMTKQIRQEAKRPRSYEGVNRKMLGTYGK